MKDKDPELSEATRSAVIQGLAESAAGKTVDLGSFAKYANETLVEWIDHYIAVAQRAPRAANHPDRITINSDEMDEAEIVAVSEHLAKMDDAELTDDASSYAGVSPGSCHIWIATPFVQLYAGFRFQGKTPPKLQLALDTWRRSRVP